ncbi:glycosyltransferase [Microbacterium sp. CFH 31415]|uniref:glycosyltransferase n=1 Tax=Microbacterium sp. CFH 31415 TaxID=2921732 RepID=UPI001F139D9A|nr:glycosyltransferase [Microbacterium sp. CFH 31415]MCH6231348.1 glycosyltransferase [Microbacterium sp. CFH 31415]
MTDTTPSESTEDAPRPHLLYVAWGFPPCRGSGVYRAWATANAFAAAGWDVTVLTVPREVFTLSTGVDESLERTVDPRIEIVRVPFDSAAFQNDLRRWPWLRATAPELWNVLNARKEQRTFPERTYGLWRPALETAALDVHARHPVDLVLGTANPHVDFTPGLRLHRDHGIPYVMDYRDAWQLDVFTGARLSAADSAVAEWERELIADAHAVWFVNEPILRWHAELYPEAADRFRVVSNGYDSAPDDHPGSTEGDGLVFGYLGTISSAVPIDRLVEGWKVARSRSPLVAASRIELWGHLNHVGTPNEAVSRQMAGFAENGIAYRGPVPKQDVGHVYSRFDALLLVLGTGRYVTSGKVFEYAATGLPIVSVHDPGNAASDVLRDAPAWYPVASIDSPDAIADALIAAAERAKTQLPEERAAARVWAGQFQRARQLDPQIDALHEFVEQRKVAQ